MRRSVLLAGIALGCNRAPDAVPCFTDALGAGHLDLQSAIDASPGGSVTVCAGEVDAGPVLIVSDVELSGVDDTETTLFTTGIDIQGGSVAIRDLGIDSEGLGITATGATLSLTEVRVDHADGDGMRLTDCATTIDHVRVDNTDDEGLVIDGGTLTGEGLIISDTHINGLHLANAPTVTLSDVDISTVDYTNEAGFIFVADGIGLLMEGGSVSIDGLEITGADIGGLQIETGELQLTNARIAGGFAGILGLGATVVADSLTIEGTTGYGAYLRNMAFDATALTITTDPDTSNGSGDSGSSGSYGLYVGGGSATVTGGTVTGNNGGGIYGYALAPNLPVSLTLTDVNIVDNARYGLVVDRGSLVATRVTIDGVRNRTNVCEAAGVHRCDDAVWMREATVRWDGGSIVNHRGWGFRTESSSLLATDLSLIGTPGPALVFSGGGLVWTRGTIDGYGQVGIQAVDGTDVVLRETSLLNGQWDEITEGDTATTVSDRALAFDLRAADLVVTDSQIADGDGLIEALGGSVTIADSVLSGFPARGIAMRSGTVTLDGSSLDGIAAPVLSVDDGELVAVDSGIADVKSAVLHVDVDGTAIDLPIVGATVTGRGSRLVCEDFTVRGGPYGGVAWNQGSFDWAGGSVANVDGDALTVRIAGRAPEVAMVDLRIEDAGRDGLVLDIESGGTAFLDGVDVVGAGDRGIALIGGQPSLDDVRVEGGQTGLWCDSTQAPEIQQCDVGISGATVDSTCDGCP